VPGSHRDLLERPLLAVLATRMPDGQAQTQPVWCSLDGNDVPVNTTRGGSAEGEPGWRRTGEGAGLVPVTAAYDEIADWYESTFLARQAEGDPLGIRAALTGLLGPGAGTCLEIGCGTGVYAAALRELGRTPVGVDLSAGMLRHARPRLPVARADAARLPVGDGALPAVVAVMAHTDMPRYPDVLREVARVLRPGGTFVHIGVHPCFCGGFADRGDERAVVIRPGYRDGRWTRASWTDQGVRDKVGASHWPLADLLNAFGAAGLVLERFAEGGPPTPIVLAARARRPA
jgi:SAM-dependent methyltransferase